jgi:hypothetical protein
VNNYFKPGPATLDDVKHRIAKLDNAEKYGFSTLWYIEGNYMEGSPEISKNNWAGGIDFEEGTSEARNRQLASFEFAPVITQTAVEAYDLVLKNAGAINPKRDSQDERIVAQIKTGEYKNTPTGIIDSVDQAGGWPKLKSGVAPKDSDHDGIPDEWEKAHGLNSNNPSDATSVNSKDGYTNLETYINSLVADPYKKS